MPSSISWASVRSRSAVDGTSPDEVALELLVVAGDDLLDQLLVAPMLLIGDVVGERLGVVATVGLVLEALVA